MNFFEAIKNCIDNNYANFKSRASRSEFWYFTLFVLICMLIAMLLSKLLVYDFLKIGADDPLAAEAFFIIFYLFIVSPIIIPSISVTVRRFHDFNQSGWSLGLFFPFMYLDKYLGTELIFIVATLIILYAICSLKGTGGKNKYGYKPKK